MTAPAFTNAAVQVRRARLTDVDALTRIEQAAFTSDRLSRRSLRHLVRSPATHVLVVERDGEVAGYAALIRRRGTRVARLYSLAVDPARRALGLGEVLLRAAEAAARAGGAERLRLEVRVDNMAASRLYRRAGFVTSGPLPRYYQDGTDGVRMEKPLEDRAA